MMPTFVRWGPPHLVAIALTALVPLLLSWWCYRKATLTRTRLVGTGFSLMLLGTIVAQFLWLDRGLAPRWQDMMPLHLCDLALFACAIACLGRNQRIFEIAYFWGLAGTLHGLLTPELEHAFPAPEFWFFFLGHGGIIGSVLFMVAGMGMRPHRGSVFRAFFTTLVYGAVAAIFNLAFDTNYGFICAKPSSASLLDLMGPWPWYLLSLAVAGIISFLILYLPWALVDQRQPRP